MNLALLVLIYAVSTGIIWLGSHINEFIYARVPHKWSKDSIMTWLAVAAICCFIGYAVWFVLALVVSTWNLHWWHPVVGLIIMLVVGASGGIATGKYAIRMWRMS
ncbi:hypothetical protein K2Q08_01225 [Patescibacteria group bacterium]|nr:hypothetical protein [Patescibacteria group bacterium]